MLAWILQSAGLRPGFLVGGVPRNFGVSARVSPALVAGENESLPAWTALPPFVIEADEYDTAFFDKRSKFVHYRPEIAILNNLEFDHADIFPDLAAIERQFHHFVRTVPGNGTLVAKSWMGFWTKTDKHVFGKDLTLAQDAANAAGAATPLGKHAQEIYKAFDAAGHGGVDFSGIIQHVRSLAAK